MNPRYLVPAAAAVLLVSCGTEETLVTTTVSATTEQVQRCSYTWREDDGWAFISWALDMEGGSEALAIQSGFSPNEIPETGEEIVLPVSLDLSEALERRLEAARLVREATQVLDTGDTASVRGLLIRAMDIDPDWSVPAYDLSLLMLHQEGPGAVLELLQPIAYKFDAALLQSRIAWNSGSTEEALRQLEICLMDDNPPFQALAAAALIYTVTGNYYQASGIWREILASPEADASIRLMAAEYAILYEEREMQR